MMEGISEDSQLRRNMGERRPGRPSGLSRKRKNLPDYLFLTEGSHD